MKVIPSRESKHNGLHRTFSVFLVLLFNSFVSPFFFTDKPCIIARWFCLFQSAIVAPRKCAMKVWSTEVKSSIVLPRLWRDFYRVNFAYQLLFSSPCPGRFCAPWLRRQIYLRASSFRKIPRPLPSRLHPNFRGT